MANTLIVIMDCASSDGQLKLIDKIFRPKNLYLCIIIAVDDVLDKMPLNDVPSRNADFPASSGMA